jgi:hypothetical protein
MPYNLPSAWDAGYALPDNVLDEGLERRAFVTKQMPRGSYDNPAVGTGGYAVPQYIKDEGYGQGTHTTTWQPSGSYVGPRVPKWLNRRPTITKVQQRPGGQKVFTVRAMGDDEAPMPAMFNDYGQRAASALFDSVGHLPPAARIHALRKVMDSVDKSLWARTQEIAKRYIAQGATPQQAVPHALARALSTGIAAEIIQTGLRRQAPQAASLLGLGCYGPTAMGLITADDLSRGTRTTTTKTRVTTTAGTVVVSPDTSPVQIEPVPSPTPAPAPAPPPVVTVGGFAFNPAALTRVWATGSAPSATVANRAAPPDVMIDDPQKVPQEVIDYLRDQLLTPVDGEPTRSFCSTDAATGFPTWDASTWFGRFGITCETPLNLHPLWHLRTTIAPFARVKNEFTGEDMVLHITLGSRDPSKPPDPGYGQGAPTNYTNPLVLKAWLSKVPDRSLWDTIWKGVTYLPMKIATGVIAPVVAPIVTPIVQGGIDLAGAVTDAVKDGINKLGDLACSLLQTPGVGAAAGAAAGTAAGVPPQAGAAAGQTGAQIAQGVCGAPPPPVAPPPPAGPSVLTLALLGGGVALAAVALLGGKRSESP